MIRVVVARRTEPSQTKGRGTMFLGPQGLIILIIAMVAGLLTQSFVNSAYRKNSRIPLPPV